MKNKINESKQRMKKRASSKVAANKLRQQQLSQTEDNRVSKSKAMVGAGASAIKKGFGKLSKVKGLMQSRESKFNEEVLKF